MWNLEWLGVHVCILQEAAELGPFNLLKGLVTGNDPLRYVSLEGLYVKGLFLVLWSA
jgi:hypothetical protein